MRFPLNRLDLPMLKSGFRQLIVAGRRKGLSIRSIDLMYLGKRGEGGEYTVQTGFGWTNGLAMYYLKLYGNRLSVPDCP
jgi:hypothetical protein